MELAVVRSRPMDPKQFLDVVSALQRGFRSRRFKYYGKEVPWLYRRNLPSLVAFKPWSPEVGVDHSEPCSMQSYDGACVFLETLASEVEGVTRYAIWLHLLERSSQLREEDRPDGQIRIDAEADGFTLGVSLYEWSPGNTDLAYRKALFERLFREMGLGDIARAEMKSGKLVVSVAKDFTVKYLIYDLIDKDLGAVNPKSFLIKGFGSFRDLAKRARALLLLHPDQLIKINKFLEFRDHGTYEHAREKLGCYVGWKCTLFGSLRANPVSDPSILERDDYPQIPLFEWEKGETQFQGEAQKTPDGWVLEITSTCPDSDQLLQIVSQYAAGWTVV